MGYCLVTLPPLIDFVTIVIENSGGRRDKLLSFVVAEVVYHCYCVLLKLFNERVIRAKLLEHNVAHSTLVMDIELAQIGPYSFLGDFFELIPHSLIVEI